MENFRHIKIERYLKTATLWLSRPEQRNALHPEMLQECIEALQELATDADIRVLALRGEGDVFCSGADLGWMQASVDYSADRNEAEARLLAHTFEVLNQFPKPTVAVVHGAVMGGGNGLLAACDIGIGLPNTLFAFSEVKLGLIPATIAPYVVDKMGSSAARALFLTGKKFNAMQALNYGLLHEVCAKEDLDERLQAWTDELLAASPQAQAACKQLLRAVKHEWPRAQLVARTAAAIAAQRTTMEAQEGLKAFFEKRKPNWT